jgi:predicted DNA-binding ribbon-helix-helix protein
MAGTSQKPTSFRLDEKNLTKLKERARRQNRSMNDLLTGLVEQELSWETEGQLESELAVILADRVSALLRSETTWAKEILRKTGVAPSEGVLRIRMSHYAEDKAYFSHYFAKWLATRVSSVLDGGEDVFILLDAGSTILQLCSAFWVQLREIARVKRKTKLTLVTSNYPAATSYTRQIEAEAFHEGTEIRFEMLGGLLQSKYGALTGARTLDALRELANRKERPKGRYISIVAGNYIRLEPDTAHAVPAPLVSGEGQKDVKSGYMSVGDEVYIACASPGKVFLALIGETLRALKPNRDLASSAGKRYEDVKLMNCRPRLVTALREKGLLAWHSRLVRKSLGAPFTSIEDIEGESVTGDFSNIGHMCYFHDLPILSGKGSPKTVPEQLHIEFPHQFPDANPELSDPGYRAALEMVRDLFHVEEVEPYVR